MATKNKNENTTKISLTASQAKFLQQKEAYTLFCAGYGSGKSYLMGLMVVLDAMHSKSADIGVYEPEKKHIRTVAIPAVQHWLDHFNIQYSLNKNESTIYVTTPGIGNIMFFPMDNPATLVGYQTYSSHIDELDTLDEDKAQEMWSKILGRNRLNPQDIAAEHKVWSEAKQCYEAQNKIRAYSTPEGFKFCYKKFKAQKLPNHSIVHGSSLENPALPSSFIDELKNQYTEQQLAAYLNGKFVNLTAGTVYYAYDRENHRSFETVQPNETLYIGCDFNVNNMSATIYVKRKGGLEWHAVDEMHGLRDTPDMVAVIQDRYQLQGHRIIMYPDSSGNQRSTTNASTSDIALLRQAGFMVRAKASNPRVKDRILATNKAFEERRILVNYDICPQVASCFEQQAYNKSGEPDKSGGMDHQNDASTYPIAYELPVKKRAFSLDIGFKF